MSSRSDNSKKIDHLTEDPIIPNQLWCCISFISPEGVKNCNMRGLKVRGVYSTKEEASERAKYLQEIDPDFHIFVGECGKWLSFDPDVEEIEDQQYSDKKLQHLVDEYKKNRRKAKVMEEERKREILEDNVKREAGRVDKQKDKMRKKLEQNKANKAEENAKQLEENQFNEPSKKLENLEEKIENVEMKQKEDLIKTEKQRITNNEDEINKITNNLVDVDDKINQLQKIYKEMLLSKSAKSSN